MDRCIVSVLCASLVGCAGANRPRPDDAPGGGVESRPVAVADATLDAGNSGASDAGVLAASDAAGLAASDAGRSMAFDAGAPAAGLPLVVPLGNSSWNAFQVLGLNAEAVAVREVTLFDVGEPEQPSCENPGLDAVLRGRVGTETLQDGPSDVEGVTLHLWTLPPVGVAAFPRGPRGVVYRSGLRSDGCSSESDARRALAQLKGAFADARVDITAPPAHADLLFRAPESDFKGSCFMVGKKPRGCTLSRTASLGGQPAELAITLEARSDCVTRPGEEPEMGCQVTRRYRGSIRHRGSEMPFDLVAPPRGDNSQVRLEGIAVSATPEVTVAVFYFSWCYVSCRERVPVVLRVR